ncbi:MAG: YkgJ family cysteine cluster protein [Bacteroidales bacterium]|nr:YkgJ family cysteine cluster protein [Bacteroidales bacterium]
MIEGYENLESLVAKAEANLKMYRKKNLKQLKKMDCEIHELHHTYTDKIDCLQCANCCKTLGPLITDADIKRMAKALRLSPSEVVASYLRIDEDGDYVFKEMPCPFLMADNYCIIYENRPKACREYPHTDRKKFYQVFNLSIKNAYTCPIAYEVLSGILRIKK